MALLITDNCINCDACIKVCPNNAIYERKSKWKLSEGTKLSGNIKLSSGTFMQANSYQLPLKEDIYFIVPDKCTECRGFFNEPQCAKVCPVDCCKPDINHFENKETLINKHHYIHKI